ncbi:PAS domain S-box protein [Aerosakkonemataceae cyanobacterium BLCC-F154]|uniref:histidine kinase n=1 Tax=Floridaenema fluviatile BLCC-F154 TaxID=3153640 RepID=A0ABV4YIT6_9CYAN
MSSVTKSFQGKSQKLKHLQAQVVQLEQQLAEAKQAEKRSRQLLQSIIDASPDGIFVKDCDFRCILANRSFATNLGTTPDSILGKNELELGYSEEQVFGNSKAGIRGFRADDLEVLAGKITRVQEVVTTVDGIKIFDVRKFPLSDDQGKLYGILGFAEDITERKQVEAERQKFVALVENSSDLIGMADFTGNPFFINSAGLRMIGLDTLEDLKNINITKLHPQSTSLTLKNVAFRQALATGYWRGEGELIHQKSGVLIDVEILVFLVLDSETGDPVCIATVQRDITERKQAELAIEHTKKFLESVLNNLPVAVVAKEAKELKFSFFNQAAEQLFGLTEQQVLGKNDYDLFTKTQADSFTKIDRQVLASGQTVDIFEEEAQIQGDIHILRTKKTAILDELGEATYLLAITEDITERKRAEEALKKSESQLRKKTEDLEQTLQELRRTQTQLVQSEKMSSLGQLVAGVAHEINNPVNFIFGNLTHAKEYTQDLLGLVELYQGFYPNPHPDIQAEVEAIELDFLIEDLPKLLNSMKVGADRIQKIVASLRTFSRMDEAEMKDVNIHEGIDSTLMILQNRLKAKPDRPEIQVTKEYSNLPLIECYAGQLNQVFMNIVANAIDALEDAYNAKILANPAISIHTKLIKNNQVMIRFTNNGPGISEKVKSRLFDPFFTTKPIGKGTGMGLSISYQIITEKHGGSLDCVSKSEKGTEFVIKIPLKQAIRKN